MISDSLKVKIQDWIIKHPSVLVSPITKDTILVRDCIIDKTTNRVGKYVIQIFIRKLYNDSINQKMKED